MHLSFALGELGLRLSEFYDMGWNEYLIKCYAWQRMELSKWQHTRLIAFESKIGSHLNPKTLPKSLNDYIDLGDKVKRRNKVSDEHRAQYEKMMKEYEVKVKSGEIEDIRVKLGLKGFKKE